MTTRITNDLINGNPSFRNRLVNGRMSINQRGTGTVAIPSATGSYIYDNWGCFSNAGGGLINVTSSTNAPTGTPFANSILSTTQTSRTVTSSEHFHIAAPIEGSRIVDFNFGTASAKTIVISFWAISNVTGAYGGSVRNGGGTRSYPFSYTINTANTWEQKTIVVTGDTTGTWSTSTSLGMTINFLLGAGTNLLGTANTWQNGTLFGATGSQSIAATFSRNLGLTGVQVEIGQSPSAFDFIGIEQELIDCQRTYFEIEPAVVSRNFDITVTATSTTVAQGNVRFPVQMRAAPTALIQNGFATNYALNVAGTLQNCSSVPTFAQATRNGATTTFTVSSGLVAGQSGQALTGSSLAGFLAWSTEMI